MSSLWVTSCGGSAVYKVRRKILSQNFIYNRTLVKQLVRGSSIGFQDIVLEIGPGKGFITSELLQTAKQVIAVEVDPKLVLHLESFFQDHPKLDLYFADILLFPLPRVPYKVFANIPFSIEGKILRKLIDHQNPPQESYVVVRKDLAERLSGTFGNNQFVIKYKPWFEFSIYYRFKRTDFIPNPSMDCVMWRIQKRTQPFIPVAEKEHYQQFIERAFGDGLAVDKNLKKILSSSQIASLKQKLTFSLKVTPRKLSLEQWRQIYQVLYS